MTGPEIPIGFAPNTVSWSKFFGYGKWNTWYRKGGEVQSISAVWQILGNLASGLILNSGLKAAVWKIAWLGMWLSLAGNLSRRIDWCWATRVELQSSWVAGWSRPYFQSPVSCQYGIGPASRSVESIPNGNLPYFATPTLGFSAPQTSWLRTSPSPPSPAFDSWH